LSTVEYPASCPSITYDSFMGSACLTQAVQVRHRVLVRDTGDGELGREPLALKEVARDLPVAFGHGSPRLPGIAVRDEHAGLPDPFVRSSHHAGYVSPEDYGEPADLWGADLVGQRTGIGADQCECLGRAVAVVSGD